MIPHPRRVFSCHGDGAKVLKAARSERGLSAEAQPYFRIVGDEVWKRAFSADWLDAPICRIEAAPRDGDCHGIGDADCGPATEPLPTERPGIPKSEPRPDRCLRLIPRVEDAVATVEGLSARLIRVSVNGCGLHFADMEVCHERGGRAVLRLELSWHHRVFVACSWVGSPPPLSVARAVTQAIDAALARGMDDDLEG